MIGGLVARHAITIVRAPLVDDGRGNETRDWRNAEERVSKGWAVDAGNTAEDEVNRDGASVEYTLRGPYGADIAASDRVRLLGGLYAIEGGVARQPGATPLTSHTLVRLIAWEG